MPSFAVIFPAAGQSTRFGGGRNKLLEVLAGRPVVTWAVSAFLSRADVAQAVIVTDRPEELSKMLPADERIRFTGGGASRSESVALGLAAVGKEIEWVAVHDAARPLVSGALIGRTLAAAVKYGAAVPAMPMALTVKEATGPLPAKVVRTVPREKLWAMQTPQIMRREAMVKAYEQRAIPLAQVTDDALLLELSGQAVWLVDGEQRNLKITTAMDMRIAEMLVAEIREAEAAVAAAGAAAVAKRGTKGAV